MLADNGGGTLGIHVPQGDPAQLEGAAHDLRAVGSGLNHVAEQLTMAGQVRGWTGVASFSFADTCVSDARGLRRGAEAMLTAAQVVDRLADDLREVERVTKHAAEEAQTASATVSASASEADKSRAEAQHHQTAADEAMQRIAANSAIHGGAATTLGDMTAYSTGLARAQEARRQAERMERKVQRAREDLAQARATAGRANERYQRLARQAANALEALTADAPVQVRPTHRPDLPVSGLPLGLLKHTSGAHGARRGDAETVKNGIGPAASGLAGAIGGFGPVKSVSKAIHEVGDAPRKAKEQIGKGIGKVDRGTQELGRDAAAVVLGDKTADRIDGVVDDVKDVRDKTGKYLFDLID